MFNAVLVQLGGEVLDSGCLGRDRHVGFGVGEADDVGALMGEHGLVPADTGGELRVGGVYPGEDFAGAGPVFWVADGVEDGGEEVEEVLAVLNIYCGHGANFLINGAGAEVEDVSALLSRDKEQTVKFRGN